MRYDLEYSSNRKSCEFAQLLRLRSISNIAFSTGNAAFEVLPPNANEYFYYAYCVPCVIKISEWWILLLLNDEMINVRLKKNIYQ